MAPPRCAGCQKHDVSELRTEEMRAKWAASEGVKWRRLGKTTHWLLCLECHRKAWPADNRCNNRHCKPGEWVVWPLTAGRTCVNTMGGKFFLTTPPPEISHDVLLPTNRKRRLVHHQPKHPRHVQFSPHVERIEYDPPEWKMCEFGADCCDICGWVFKHRVMESVRTVSFDLGGAATRGPLIVCAVCFPSAGVPRPYVMAYEALCC